MPTLLELQDAMRAELLGTEQPTAAGTEAARFVRGAGIDPQQRLQIHRNHMRISLSDALAGIHPAVEAMVGAEFFRAVAAEYIARQPPCEPMLYAYGSGFAGFLSDFPPAASLPCLPDLARLEWAMHESFHAADQPGLAADVLAAVPAERLERVSLNLRADARLVASAWPVDSLWRAALMPESNALEALDLDAGGASLLLLRQEHDVHMWRLPPAEWHWLAACGAGRSMAQAAEQAAEADPSFDLAAILAANLQRGTFGPLPADGANKIDNIENR